MSRQIARLRTSGLSSPSPTHSLRNPARPYSFTSARHAASASAGSASWMVASHQSSSFVASSRWRSSKKGQLRSVTLKLRRLFRRERFIRAAEIVGLHAARLRMRFHFERLVERYVPFRIELLLGHRVGDARPLCELVRE